VADVTDHILINGLRVVSVIGVLDHERLSAQPLQIDVDIHVDLRSAGASDDLTQTVHYGEVCMQLGHRSCQFRSVARTFGAAHG